MHFIAEVRCTQVYRPWNGQIQYFGEIFDDPYRLPYVLEGTYFIITCDPWFVASGNTTSQCTSDGWNPLNYTCVGKKFIVNALEYKKLIIFT